MNKLANTVTSINPDCDQFQFEAIAFTMYVASWATVAKVVDEVFRLTNRFGVETLFFCGVPGGRQTFAETFLAKRGGDEWFSEYTRKEYFRVDPVIREVRRNGRPFLWSEIVVNQDKSPDGAAVMSKRHAYGFNDGLVVPIHSPGNRANLVSMSGTHLNLTSPARQLLPLVAIRAFERIQDINLIGPPHKSSLTARECEILSYVARGESAARIGGALTIAESTVEAHVRNACLKLGAFNRAHAVAIAISDNLIAI